MIWQMIVVVALILLAGIYLCRETLKTWNSSDACGGCHCPAKKKIAKTNTLIGEQELTARLRNPQA